jgi:hypothetical protein
MSSNSFRFAAQGVKQAMSALREIRDLVEFFKKVLLTRDGLRFAATRRKFWRIRVYRRGEYQPFSCQVPAAQNSLFFSNISEK